MERSELIFKHILGVESPEPCLNISGIFKKIIVYFVYYLGTLRKDGEVFFTLLLKVMGIPLWKQGKLRHTEGSPKTEWGGAPGVWGGSVDGKESATFQDLKIVRLEELFLLMYLPYTYGALNKKQTWVVTVNDDSGGEQEVG